MKIVGQSKSFISRDEETIEPSIFVQSEAERCYFVALSNISSTLCVSMEIWFLNLPNCRFLKKIAKVFKFFNFYDIALLIMSKYTSCPLLRNIDFWASYAILRFYRFKRTLNRIHKIVGSTFQKKAVSFVIKNARALNFCHFMFYMMYLKVPNCWDPRKIFSMCKTDYTEGSA